MIRYGTEQDILKVSRLWLRMVNELDPELTPNIEWWRVMALGNLKGGNYFFLVAEEGGKLLGFLDWFLYPEPGDGKVHAVFQHFYVLPECRNGGVAMGLYKRGDRLAKQKGAQVQSLFCFPKEKSFWERHGFETKRNLMRRMVA